LIINLTRSRGGDSPVGRYQILKNTNHKWVFLRFLCYR